MKPNDLDEIQQELHFMLMRMELAERAHEVAQRIADRIQATLNNSQRLGPPAGPAPSASAAT
jgi:hypothetical protein